MKKYLLPEYPCASDVWDTLAAETRPIVVYGMGNGADKLFRRFDKYGIEVAEIFASDGFVRGHYYNGYKVKSFSEIKEMYDDFVIVLSFASNRQDVIDMLSDIDSKYVMYVPDMPVAGEDEYFDREFYNLNYERIRRVYGSLCDEESRCIYAAVINYKLSGKMTYLTDAVTEKSDMYSLIGQKKIRTVVDAGAYNGDTAKDAIEYFSDLERIYAIEPDKKTYKRLVKFAEASDVDIRTVNAAVWSRCSVGSFNESGNRNSSVSSTASFEHKVGEVELITVDSLGIAPDYIKYDVEGAEYEALLGSLETISRAGPTLLVSLYHRSRDIFEIPELISERLSGYSFYIRRLRSVPAWEMNLILIKF